MNFCCFIIIIFPTATQQHKRYIRAAAVCPCPILKVSTPGNPHMCEHCALLRHVITKLSTDDCPACASPYTDNGSPSTCASCIIFALIHQNTFVERWNDMQHGLAPDRSSQLHPSLNSPQPDHSVSPAQTYGASPESTNVLQLASSASVIRHCTNLVLSPHTHIEIQTVQTSNPSSPLCTKIHLDYPTIPLMVKNLHSLHDRNKPISLPPLFHHLRITATSLLLLRDRSLSITLDKGVHIMTPPTLNGETPPHRLHLFLNSHNRMLFLRHTHDVDEHTRYRLEITTSLPETHSRSSNLRHRPMMRTTSHTLDLVTTLTFPVVSNQHQLTIMTLATHLLLSIPCIKQMEHVWNTVRTQDSHQYNLQLILATITLERYHKVWFTILQSRSPARPHPPPSTPPIMPLSLSTVPLPFHFRHIPSKCQR